MISDYIEGEFSIQNKKIIEDHVDECPDCSETVSNVKILREKLRNLEKLQTSPDFETVLRTRIRIEAGIGRRRLQEIFWTWPARVPIYGMAFALIIIAIVLVVEQVNKSYQGVKPEAKINTEWYGGNPEKNPSNPLWEESGNVIYVIERMSPEDFINQHRISNRSTNSSDSTKIVTSDSMGQSNSMIRQVNLLTY